MNTQPAATAGIARGRSIVLALIIATSFIALLPSGLLAVESSPTPEAACQSAADLRLIIGFQRDTDPSANGRVPVVVGVIAGLTEARQLAGFVGDTYRPLVDALTLSLESLRTTLEEVGG